MPARKPQEGAWRIRTAARCLSASYKYVLLGAVVALIVGASPVSSEDARYARAHKAAVKYRHQRDDLQRRLTLRVHEARGLRRTLVRRPSSLEAIRLASIAYHVDYRQMYAIASCETGGSFNRYSKNPSSTASGLFQFLTSTFAGTPFGRESIWSPYANALAAGWMMAQGRRGEWVC